MSATTGRLGSAKSLLGAIVLGTDLRGDVQVVSQTLAFVQLAVGDSKRYAMQDSLSFVQVVSAAVTRRVSVSQSIAFAQVGAQGTVAHKSVSDSLTLVSTAVGTKVVHASVSQSLGLIQTLVVRGPVYKTASNALALVQSTHVLGPVYQSVTHNLGLVENVNGHLGVINVFVGQALNFSQKAGRIINVSVSQSIAFTQIGERRNTASQTLAFSQLVRVGKGGDVQHTLALVDVVQVTGVFRRSPTDNLGLTQSVTFYIDRGCTRFDYTPFVGSSTDPNFTPPPTTAPTLGYHRLLLTYPYVSPSVSLTLRNPAFGDKDRLGFNRINRVTRGGTLIVFSDPKWPKTETLSVQVDGLTQRQANDVIDFLRSSLGKEIGLLDWENRQWRGVIITPDARITHVGKGDLSVAFDFQGSLA
jgi:hypothetical protein